MLKYRPDIDGLRALAVVPVVLFHADITLFSGGFVGVDIFFVISGYLITAMLLQDIAVQRFSILDFYERRARRILPALLTVVAVTVAAGFILLLPRELEQLAKAVQRIAVFTSNHLFWQTKTDYWQQNALVNQPLLHTWSLAVEEQFYLIVPILLWLCWKLHQRLGILTALLLLGTASLAVSQYWLHTQPAAAFYLLPARAFELIIGAVLALVLVRGNRQSLASNQCIGVAGLFAIGISIFYYHDKMPFPGIAALLPCLGAAAVIYAGAAQCPEQISWVNKLLQVRALVFIGLISYSLYLWHWPVLVLLRSIAWYARGLPEVPTGLTLIAITLVSWASWRWVERPFRKRKQSAAESSGITAPPPRITLKQQGIALSSSLCALVLCWGLGAGAGQMVKHQHLPSIIVQFNQETATTPGVRCEGNADPEAIHTGIAGCVLGDTQHTTPPAFAILGDSHARMWAEGLNLFGVERHQSILMLAYSSCTPIVDYVAPTRPECAEIFNHVLSYIVKSSIQKIVLAGYWSYATVNMGETEKMSIGKFKEQLKKTIDILQEAGKTVYIMADIPVLISEESVWKHFVQSLRTAGTAAAAVHSNHYVAEQVETNSIILQLQKTHHIQVLDPTDVICPNSMCTIVDQGRTLYKDKHHLTDAASQKFHNIFTGMLDVEITHQRQATH